MNMQSKTFSLCDKFIHALVKEQRLDIINGDRQMSEKKSSEPKRK